MAKGTIKAYSPDVNAGVIECDSGNTYEFRERDWSGDATPVAKQKVRFDGASRTATKVSAE